ncbi:MAG: hypothetical protein AUI14_01590 [Actinobacteria bacterium 13_2_20CM_2_71_6]|nr:MAG: hypothetical protein AUI14_01590 [Actinobacteria bacterium 13_2_20CM_2_71_6]
MSSQRDFAATGAGSPDVTATPREPIAIVGMACRLPGAANPTEFWELLLRGENTVSSGLPARHDLDWSETAALVGNRELNRWGGFLDGVEEFDADFFGISQKEATCMDPAQRLILEVAWEAVEDSGTPVSRLAGTRTGVYAGFALMSEYWEMLLESQAADLYSIVGAGLHSTAAGRLSYLLDLRGPSLAVDAACATSLLAVHLACQSIRSGESEMALVCGANLQLRPSYTAAFARSRLMSPTAACKFGDSSADGFVRSEGVLAVFLKPLSRAVADGDRVYASILGSGVSNDGRSSRSLVAPSAAGQVDALRIAYRDAGVSPRDLDYVEAHGTGTPAGDREELIALGQVLGDGRPSDEPCLVGSSKSNVGHTETVAGLTGLVKTALALRDGTIPRTLHVQQPHPLLTDSSLRLVDTNVPWPERGGRRLAGVNSLGLSATNVHVVLADGPTTAGRGTPARDTSGRVGGGFLLPLSACSPQALRDLSRAYVDRVASAHNASELSDICYSAGARRNHHDQRAFVLGADREQLLVRLRDLWLADPPGTVDAEPGDTTVERPPVAFVFPADGGHWIGKGRALTFGHDAFAAAVEECDRAVQRELGHSVVNLMCGDEPPSGTPLDQMALWMLQVGLAAVWRDWGIEPDRLIGHGPGEIAAATVAGALTIAEAAALICRCAQMSGTARQRAAMASRLVDELTGAGPTRGGIPEHRAVLARLAGDTGLDAGHWTVTGASEPERTWFVEISPHPTVAVDGTGVGSLRLGRPESTVLLESLGRAYLAGCSPRWDRVYRGSRYVTVPTYPWQRKRYWLDGWPIRDRGSERPGRPTGSPVGRPPPVPGRRVPGTRRRRRAWPVRWRNRGRRGRRRAVPPPRPVPRTAPRCCCAARRRPANPAPCSGREATRGGRSARRGPRRAGCCAVRSLPSGRPRGRCRPPRSRTPPRS